MCIDTTKHEKKTKKTTTTTQPECIYNCGESGFPRDHTKGMPIGLVDRDNDIDERDIQNSTKHLHSYNIYHFH